MRLVTRFFLSLISIMVLPAVAAPATLELSPDGKFKANDLEFGLLHFNAAWAGSESTPERLRLIGGADFSRGDFLLRDGYRFQVERSRRHNDDGSETIHYRFHSADAVPTRQLALNLRLPAHRYRDQELKTGGSVIQLPHQPATTNPVWRGKARSLAIPVDGGFLELTTEQEFLLQDDRTYHQPFFSLRVPISGDERQRLTDAELELTLRFVPGANTLPGDAPLEVTEGRDYVALEYRCRTTPGSALDLSGLLDAPAGKYGPIRINDEGKLEFTALPGKPQRFWGTNLIASANFPDHSTAEALAEELAAAGYNSVRLHHFDYQLVGPDGKFDPDQLDRLDFLASRLIARGIYLNIDLFSARAFPAGSLDGIDQSLDLQAFKQAIPVSEEAFAAWQNYAETLLNHVNSYTGRAWKEEPALIGIALVNEGNLENWRETLPVLRDRYQSAYREWRKENPSPAALPNDFDRFLLEFYTGFYQRMVKVVRNTGCALPLTDQNMRAGILLEYMRRNYDYVDNHFYWDHPRFLGRDWSLPAVFSNTGMIDTALQAINYIALTRIVGKPFFVTEFNWAYPNRHRAEAGIITATVAAQQQWDAVYRFAFAHGIASFKAPEPMNFFDSSRDPLHQLSDRFAALTFLRGDVAPGRELLPVALPPSLPNTAPLPAGYPVALSRLALIGRTGSVFQESCNAFSFNDQAQAIAKTGCGPQYRFDTGESSIDTAAGTMVLTAPRCSAVVMPGTGRLTAGALSVENRQPSPLTVALTSLDGKALHDSSRLLLLTLGDVQNSGARYQDSSCTRIDDFGKLPLLAKTLEAEITLALSGVAFDCYALDLSGNRIGVRPFDNGQLRAEIRPGTPPVLAYELIRKE